MPTYGLAFSDIYSRIQDYANISNVVNSAAKAKKAANDALRLISSLRDWEKLRRESTVTLTASTQTFALSGTPDFDHIISAWYLSNGQRISVEVVDDYQWDLEVNESQDGDPQICRVTKVNGTLSMQLSPRPSASFIAQYTNIKFDYVKKPVELSADADIPDIPDTSQQMAIVYLAVADLLAKQGDLNGMAAWELKANRLLNQAHKIDDKKQGSRAKMGTPLISINESCGRRSTEYNG